MENEIVIENGNKKVSISEDKYGVYLSVMDNGYQSSSVRVDDNILDMIEQAILKSRDSREER